MKVLPFVEDIYDLETDQLSTLLTELNHELGKGPNNAEIPPNIDSFDKFERKVNKLKDCIELELEERAQVDNVIGFFTETAQHGGNIDLLDDEAFFASFKKSQ